MKEDSIILKMRKKTEQINLVDIAKQFVKFGLVGVSNTIVYFSIYYALYFIKINYLIANMVGFVISVINSYYWNSKYVFIKTTEGHASSLLKTFVAYGVTSLLSTIFLFIVVNYFGVSEIVGPAFTLCATIPINFLLNRYWAFK